jgi:hypothetical protein
VSRPVKWRAVGLATSTRDRIPQANGENGALLRDSSGTELGGEQGHGGVYVVLVGLHGAFKDTEVAVAHGALSTLVWTVWNTVLDLNGGRESKYTSG